MKRNYFSIFKKREGQVLLLSTLIMGGMLLGASTIAGLLMLYQVRQASNVGLSAQAIFAADTGIEWSLYQRFKNANYPKPTLNNAASFEISFYPGTSTVISADYVRSVAESGRVSRAFQLEFATATATLATAP